MTSPPASWLPTMLWPASPPAPPRSSWAIPSWASLTNVDRLTDGAREWAEEQVLRKGFLVALNGPVAFVSLWLSVAVARRAFLLSVRVSAHVLETAQRGARLLLTRQPHEAAHAGVANAVHAGVAHADAAPGLPAPASPGSDAAPASPAAAAALALAPAPAPAPLPARPVPLSAWSTLRLIVSRAPTPGITVHLAGYVCTLAFSCSAVVLWLGRREGRSAGALARGLLPPLFVGVAVAASEHANEIEAHGLYGGVLRAAPGSPAALATSTAAALACSAAAAALWVRASAAALAGLENAFAEFLATAASALAFLNTVAGFEGARAGASGWTSGPLKAAAAGVALFALSFAISKIDVPADGERAAASGDGAGAHVDAAAPPRRERMVVCIARILDAGVWSARARRAANV
jgi:hypothetical protein